MDVLRLAAFSQDGKGGNPACVVFCEEMPGDEEMLSAAIHGELAAALPGLPTPRWARVITERRATFSCRPGIARPIAVTPAAGVFLAGDYVASEYPATIESTVRSGIAATRAALQPTAR